MIHSLNIPTVRICIGNEEERVEHEDATTHNQGTGVTAPQIDHVSRVFMSTDPVMLPPG